jgi:hypothetical protein
MIIKLLWKRGGNIAVLRMVCHTLRNIVCSVIRERARELDDTLFMLNEWQRQNPGKLAVHGPICFYIATGKRQPLIKMEIEVTYLGNRDDKVPHPTKLGQFAPSWDEMKPTGIENARCALVGPVHFYRRLSPITLGNLLKLSHCSYHNFGYTHPAQMKYVPWYRLFKMTEQESIEADYLNTIYFDKDLYDEAEIRRTCVLLLKSKFKFSFI